MLRRVRSAHRSGARALPYRHPGEGRDPGYESRPLPRLAASAAWTSAFAGPTNRGLRRGGKKRIAAEAAPAVLQIYKPVIPAKAGIQAAHRTR
jgi:hypothetical protein